MSDEPAETAIRFANLVDQGDGVDPVTRIQEGLKVAQSEE
jgi:hypothetical protein